MKGKVAVITGGSRGIGKACCLELAKLGADIVFTFNKSKTEANALKKEIKALGVDCLSLQVDVKDYEQCRSLAEKTLKKFKKIDILINNAGIIRDKAMLMMSREDWLDVIDTNLNGYFNVTKHFTIPFMKQKQGCIINITSLSGIIGLPRQANYAASKGGIISFTRSLAKELAGFNIRVNAIAPGFIQTDMVKDLRPEMLQRIMPMIPLERFGTPEEVSRVVAFLASEEANYITGQVIRVDGGLGM
ncbi:MAG: 3-oxoacyl-[acyl-carrier-protein] reductase [Candidatus Omnitrophota bacterium]